MELKERIIFTAVVTLIFIFMEYIVYRTLRNYINEKKLNSKKWKRIILCLFIIFTIPFGYVFFSRFIILPKIIYDIYIIPFFIFQVSVFFIAIYLLIGKIIKLPFVTGKFFLRKIEPLRNRYDILVKKKPVAMFDESRRAFIRTSTVLVSGLAFAGAGAGVLGKDDFIVKYSTLLIPKLPEEIKGLKIVQVNDIHSGPFMSFEQMCIYKKVIEDLKPDLIMIPGDITNSLASEVFPFIEAFKNIYSKYGVFVSLGNHDYFFNADVIADNISGGTPFRMLRNESQVLRINGKEILIMGTEDTKSSGVKFNKAVLQYLDDTAITAKKNLEEMKLDYESIPKVLLCHKPYLFPEMLDRNIDLILSGHTHGGQIALARIGDLNLSIAASVSPYISGLYKEKNSQMYISDGIGTVGLPIRLNCPPEISVLTLT